MRNVFGFVLAVAVLALSSGCKSDCEKAYANALTLMEKEGMSKEKLEKFKSEEKRKDALEECAKLDPEDVKCVIEASDMKSVNACEKKKK